MSWRMRSGWMPIGSADLERTRGSSERGVPFTEDAVWSSACAKEARRVRGWERRPGKGRGAVATGAGCLVMAWRPPSRGLFPVAYEGEFGWVRTGSPWFGQT